MEDGESGLCSLSCYANSLSYSWPSLCCSCSVLTWASLSSLKVLLSFCYSVYYITLLYEVSSLNKGRWQKVSGDRCTVTFFLEIYPLDLDTTIDCAWPLCSTYWAWHSTCGQNLHTLFHDQSFHRAKAHWHQKVLISPYDWCSLERWSVISTLFMYLMFSMLIVSFLCSHNIWSLYSHRTSEWGRDHSWQGPLARQCQCHRHWRTVTEEKVILNDTLWPQ